MKAGMNPKDVVGLKKVHTFVFPSIAVLHATLACMDGAQKYGPYNWRDKSVIASVYISAADRHLKAWTEREECAKDSGVHHLGHAIACLAIILDAQATGNLIDDRPDRNVFNKVLVELNRQIEERINGSGSTKNFSRYKRGRRTYKSRRGV